jgi:hypothetical protein
MKYGSFTYYHTEELELVHAILRGGGMRYRDWVAAELLRLGATYGDSLSALKAGQKFSAKYFELPPAPDAKPVTARWLTTEHEAQMFSRFRMGVNTNARSYDVIRLLFADAGLDPFASDAHQRAIAHGRSLLPQMTKVRYEQAVRNEVRINHEAS